ncbi:MAG: hypothetical protein EHM23_24695 [Acidobacteria bacterium]|nr:MAG: hypothetical protein EHM23_24695 [Acidobacteriota bacterium]
MRRHTWLGVVMVCCLAPFVLEAPTSSQSPGRHEFVVGCWSAPRHLDLPYFAWLKDHGFTHTLYWRSQQTAPEQWAADLQEAEKQGVKLVFDSWQPAAAPSEWVRAVLQTASRSPAFAGIYAPDEPGYRFPLERPERKPSESSFAETFKSVNASGRDVFCCDAVTASEENIRRFLPFCSVLGMDVYPFRTEEGGRVAWTEPVGKATRTARRLAEGKPVWMVLQGHGRADWYAYATEYLKLDIPAETGERPSQAILLDMALAAQKAGTNGVWWWSFELYDWRNPEHRAFIESFKTVNRALRSRARSGACAAP